MSRSQWARSRRKSSDGGRWLRLGSGSRSFYELLDLLEVAQEVVSDNEGVALAPALAFDSLQAAGTLLVVTDASRAEFDDGFGGYAFAPCAPGVAFLMSVPWPLVIKRAIDAAATRRLLRQARGGQQSGLLSMPAGEVFAALAMAEAVCRRTSVKFQAVVAVGDCAPAARALSRRFSRSPQMRKLVGACTRSAGRWLGVQVPREWNVDADRLSHPSQFGVGSQRVERAGLVVCRVAPPEELCAVLEEVTGLPLGRDDECWEVWT